jgi:hypothetical protein
LGFWCHRPWNKHSHLQKSLCDSKPYMFFHDIHFVGTFWIGDKYPWKEINYLTISCTYLNSYWYQHSCFFFCVLVIELSAEIATLQAAVLKTREEFRLALKLSCWNHCE